MTEGPCLEWCYDYRKKKYLLIGICIGFLVNELYRKKDNNYIIFIFIILCLYLVGTK